jgi:nucleoside-diphosphate-sugar epimerase
MISAQRQPKKSPHRVVLTGASGTLGTALLEILGNDPRYKVLVLLRKPMAGLSLFRSVSARKVDFNNHRRMKKIIQSFRPRTVVHAVATGMKSPRPDWGDLVRINVNLPLRLLEACRNRASPHFILISTALAYRNQGRPLRESDPLGTAHPYGASKAAADLVMQSAAAENLTPLTIVRAFSFTGPGDVGSRLFPSLLQAAQSENPLQLTLGRQVRDFLSARDMADGIVAVVKKTPPPVRQAAIYNLGSGVARPVRRIVEEVARELGLKVELRFGKKKAAEGEPGFLVADGRKARRELGWVPQENLAHAVWRLAKASFPHLKVREPARELRRS